MRVPAETAELRLLPPGAVVGARIAGVPDRWQEYSCSTTAQPHAFSGKRVRTVCQSTGVSRGIHGLIRVLEIDVALSEHSR